MSTDSWLRLSQISIAVEGILAALGGYGVYHFKRALEKHKEYKQDNQMAEIHSKLDKIITQNQTISEAQKQEIIKSVECVEKGYLENLKTKYDLGYALLYVDKENWYYVPRNMEVRIDWFSTKLISLSKDQVVIHLPNFIDKNNNHFMGNIAAIPLKSGTSFSPISIGNVRLSTECLDTTDNGATIVIGFGTTEK